MINMVLLLMLLASVYAIIRIDRLLTAVLLTSLFSILVASIFMVLDAVDVAFTEAAVGAGVSTIFFLAALAIVGRKCKKTPRRKTIVPMLVATATGCVLIYATLDMPRFGTPMAPVHQHVAPRYINDSAAEVGPPNIVTSVLASYRGYDTFGEVGVVFTAFIGVLLLLGAGTRRAGIEPPAPPPGAPTESMRKKVVLKEVADLVIPPVLIFALYVQWHGDFGPGGGFQAGVIFASGIFLYALIYGIEPAQKLLPPRRLAYFPAIGLLLYAAVGIISMLRGGNFLNYSVLAHDPLHGQHYGILAIELGVGITVAAVMINIFFSFSERSL